MIHNNETLKNCPECRNIDCICPKGIGSVKLTFPENIIEDWNKQADDLMNGYAKQMAENHAFIIDKTFWLVVKQKPKYMPSFLYKLVIKNLIEIQKHNETNTSTL